jgi:hypothetical protein
MSTAASGLTTNATCYQNQIYWRDCGCLWKDVVVTPCNALRDNKKCNCAEEGNVIGRRYPWGWIGSTGHIECLKDEDTWTANCENCRVLKPQRKIPETEWTKWQEEINKPNAWEMPDLSEVDVWLAKVEKQERKSIEADWKERLEEINNAQAWEMPDLSEVVIWLEKVRREASGI